MRISCIVVCHNQERTIGDAVLSFVRQTRPPDEILVADDASTDNSRELISSLAKAYPVIQPVFRERRLGVSANRDLAVRSAGGDFVTTLDGDDYVRPTKLARECEAIVRGSSSVAYSTHGFVNEARGISWIAQLPPMHELDARERLRSVVLPGADRPLGMLVAKDLHIQIGGYRHELRVYEDWDYKIRLAAAPGRWAYSGGEGVVVRVHGRHDEGLSQMPYHRHARARLGVIRANKRLITETLGPGHYYYAIGLILGWGAKWQTKNWYWQAKESRHMPHFGFRCLRDILASKGDNIRPR